MGVNFSGLVTEQGCMGRHDGGAAGRAARPHGRHRTRPLKAAPQASAPEPVEHQAVEHGAVEHGVVEHQAVEHQAVEHQAVDGRAVRAPRPAARAVRGFVIAVAVPGLVALSAVVSRRPPLEAFHKPTFWVFAAFLLASELWPLHIQRGDEQDAVTTSTTFVFALLLACGLSAALVALAVASAVSDTVHRKRWWKGLFNVGQYSLCLLASAVVLGLVLQLPITTTHFPIHIGSLLPLLLASVTFFALNNSLIGMAIALSEGVPTQKVVARDLPFQIYTAGVLLALAPIVVVAAERTLGLIPLLILPMFAVYKSASTSLAREHDALHDALTGLPNRILFRDRVEQAAARARRNGGLFAVMIVDLDGFKEVNDTLGHHVGDVLLQRVATRLQATLREGDTVSRLGGDEFAVLVPELYEENDAGEAAHRLLSGLTEPFELQDLTLGLQASVGIACYPDHGEEVDTLMQRADVAMYTAKRLHTGCELYVPNKDHSSRRRLKLTGELRGAINDEQLILHYQPKARLADGAVTSVEALVRWTHPGFGVVGPSEFIPLAEQSGVMRPLTSHVLAQALAQWRRWHEEGMDLGIAVNLSAQNFHDLRLPDEIGELLERWRVPARFLQLEITESMLIADPMRAEGVLGRLAAMDLRLEIDDFGTGYSSLAYLKRLPVHGIKIDKSFVQHLAEDENDEVIVRSTIDLARNLGLEVVAEGVESAESFERLRRFGCDYAQGFYLSRPLPAEVFERWFQRIHGRISAGVEAHTA
jgi:diguanylate cyclase (GGDEF)-like protein